MSDEDDFYLGSPDWERDRVRSRATDTRAAAPVGDPTRWGGSVAVNVPAVALNETPTPQFIRAQANDTYSRSWSINGTLLLPSAVWNVVVAPFSLAVLLEVTQGVGQTTLIQNIVLAIGGNPLAGLCNVQHVNNGGPYASTFSGPGNTLEARSFSAIGSLVGNNLAIRARYIAFAPLTGLPATPEVAAIVTPYAAGDRL